MHYIQTSEHFRSQPPTKPHTHAYAHRAFDVSKAVYSYLENIQKKYERQLNHRGKGSIDYLKPLRYNYEYVILVEIYL